LEHLVLRDLPGLQVSLEIRVVQELLDRWVPQEFRVLRVLPVLLELTDRQEVSVLPVFQVLLVQMDQTGHRALREVLEPTEVLDQLDPREHQDQLDHRVHLEIRDPLDQLVVLEVLVRLELKGPRDHQVRMELRDLRELQDLLALKARVVHRDRWDHLVRSELQASPDPMVLKEQLEPLDRLVRQGTLEIRAVRDHRVQSVARVSQEVRVPQVLLGHLVRLGSREQLDHRVVVDLLDLPVLQDQLGLQVRLDPQDLWVLPDLPETLGILVLREIKDQRGHREFQEHQAPREIQVPLERQDKVVLMDLLEHQGLLDLRDLRDHRAHRVLLDLTEFQDWLGRMGLPVLRETPDPLEMQALRD